MSSPRSLTEWLSYAHRLVRGDWDLPLVFTGYQGRGKTTLAIQLMRKLDPSFNVERIHFDAHEFMGKCKRSQPYTAHLLDEALLHRRNWAKQTQKDVVDFYQVNRSLNQITALCFPHIGGLDPEIAVKRVRWRFHIPRRGVAHVYEGKITTEHGQPKVFWKRHFGFKYGVASGALWDEYLEKKDAFVRSQEEGSEPEDAPAHDLSMLAPVIQKIKAWEMPEKRGPGRPKLGS